MDMNQKEQGEGGGAYQPAVVQKPDSQSLSILYQNPSLDSTKRRRLYENSSSRSDIFETKLVKNDDGRATHFTLPTEIEGIPQFSLDTVYTLEDEETPTICRSESSTPPQSITPTQFMSELHIKDTKKSRSEIFMEQLRIRNELNMQKQSAKKSSIDHSHLGLSSLYNKSGIPQVQETGSSQSKKISSSLFEYEKTKDIQLIRKESPNELVMPGQQQQREQPTTPQQSQRLADQTQPTPSYHQRQPAEPATDDDELIIDEEMTNRNVCIGMINTDIVVEKPPLLLTRDDQFEIVTLESEGRLNNDNYSFKVTSRSVPPKFFGWIPFKDTKLLGPLVDHQLIWWDAVIPRGKANHARTPIYIILYCRPNLLGTIAKYFESQRLYLRTPPFYNPTCRYSNPHAHIAQPQNFHQHMQPQQPQSVSQQQLQPQLQAYQYQQQQPYINQQQYYRPPEQELQRQNQKDIEMLLGSIPSDVPVITMRKKKVPKTKLKTPKTKLKRLRRGIKKRPVSDDGVIEILSDDEDSEIDELDSSSSSSDSTDVEEEVEEGYVEGLTITLMDHQIKGVSWMIDRENNQSSNGGILADDMGLGKTIQTIGLMASTMAMPELLKGNNTNSDEDADDEDQHQITLIIAPLALIHQWVDEIKTKTEYNKFRVLKHHGPNRIKNPAILRRYDVIVTTYQVVASDVPTENAKKKKTTTIDDFVVQEDDDEYDYLSTSAKPEIPNRWQPLKKGYGPLFQINWYRVVLDEAQQIKNRQTKSATACSALSAKKRWCLTGTPIQNNVDELYSLLRFLRIQPLSDYPTFKKNISLPIQNGDSRLAMERLKAVLRAVMLRRTKDVLRAAGSSQQQNKQQQQSSDESSSLDSDASSPETNTKEKTTLHLPTREKQDLTLSFSDHERGLYDLLKKKTKDTIRDMGGQSTYMNMLCLLLRLRQACDHPQLILKSIDNDKDVLDIVSDANNNSSNPSATMGSGLTWSTSSCELCGKYAEEGSSTFCTNCQSAILSPSIGQHEKLFKTSTKVRKLLEILEDTRENNPGEKTIIFSQFTSMLDLMESPLKRHGFKVCRYDGSMSSQLRERSLDRLKYDSKCTVMLISLKCGSLGLNLTAANRVILVDLWWNPALEEQAIDRVHRIGQKLPVYVTRLLIEDTVEGNILQLQNKKAELTKGALGDNLIKSTKLTASEIRSLFDL